MKNWFINTKAINLENYQGVKACAHPGLHEELCNLLAKYVKPGATVLDIGAGAGALSLRLTDMGYVVEALDIDQTKWVASDIPFRILDINKGLVGSVQSKYDAVCCVEVIEHVENPWALIRDICSLLKPSGIALVSTPNVTNFLSRLTFLVTGNFANFGPNFLDIGHINPIHGYEMREILNKLGRTLLVEQPVGYLPVMDFGEGMSLARFPYKLAVNVARLVAYLAAGGEVKNGWCKAYVFK